ncbi:MAG: hypothetical protein AAGG48_03350 [Planctomycetota bacterium]
MFSRLKQWIKHRMDPRLRAIRKENKKAEQMARFLERNQQLQEKDETT